MFGEDSFIHKTLRPWPNRRLRRGSIVGHTTATSTRLWLRTGKPGQYSLLLYRDPKGKDDPRFKAFRAPQCPLESLPREMIRRDFAVNDYHDDTTHVESVRRLKPNTVYGYALHSTEEGRIILGHDRVYSFRTMADDNGPLSFALYSCHMPYEKTIFGNTVLKNAEMWDCFRDALNRHRHRNLRFVIGGGDQAYTDGVESLSIWAYLNKVMRKEGGELVPTQDDMVTWYRDVYRGYWGFEALQNVFSDYPIYMMWDDHELGDGCGSYYLNKKRELRLLLPSLDEKGKPTYQEGLELYRRMMEAARRVYYEYQHSHNPRTPKGQWDYAFYLGDCAFYFLDGRGYRNVERASYRILGKRQFNRFKNWLEKAETKSKQFLFVDAAVPVFHVRSVIASAEVTEILSHGFADDLRDSWEHPLHDEERNELTELLFAAAARGQKVCFLSGDVHIAAAFKLRNKAGSVIYQLTSSAITFNMPLYAGWLVGHLALPENGTTREGYEFERLALYEDSNFAILAVEPTRGKVTFQLYGMQMIKPPKKTLLNKNLPFAGQTDKPLTHAIARLELDFE
ncbi:MAG: alkaline phosphatase family protein [bacterium]|nr:alkaline phosphatase family protein [bacterium]